METLRSASVAPGKSQDLPCLTRLPPMAREKSGVEQERCKKWLLVLTFIDTAIFFIVFGKFDRLSLTFFEQFGPNFGWNSSKITKAKNKLAKMCFQFLQLYVAGWIRIVVNHQLDWKAPQFLLPFLFFTWTTLVVPLFCFWTFSCFSTIFFFCTQHKVPGVKVLIKLRKWVCALFTWGQNLVQASSHKQGKPTHRQVQAMWALPPVVDTLSCCNLWFVMVHIPPFQHPKMWLSLVEGERL